MLKRTPTSVIIMAVLISREREGERERENDTCLGPQAGACYSACNGKRRPCAAPFSVVSEEYRCHMRCRSCMMHVRLVGYTEKEKQQLDMNVCVQTNESKGRCVCGKMTGWGGRSSPLLPLLLSSLSLSLSGADPAVWVLRCRGRDTQMGCSLSFTRSPRSFIICLFTPNSIHIKPQCSFIHGLWMMPHTHIHPHTNTDTTNKQQSVPDEQKKKKIPCCYGFFLQAREDVVALPSHVITGPNSSCHA